MFFWRAGCERCCGSPRLRCCWIVMWEWAYLAYMNTFVSCPKFICHISWQPSVARKLFRPFFFFSLRSFHILSPFHLSSFPSIFWILTLYPFTPPLFLLPLASSLLLFLSRPLPGRGAFFASRSLPSRRSVITSAAAVARKQPPVGLIQCVKRIHKRRPARIAIDGPLRREGE